MKLILPSELDSPDGEETAIFGLQTALPLQIKTATCLFMDCSNTLIRTVMKLPLWLLMAIKKLHGVETLLPTKRNTQPMFSKDIPMLITLPVLLRVICFLC